MVLVQSPQKVITNPDDYAAIGFYVTHSDGIANKHPFKIHTINQMIKDKQE
jgi:hypothetical protein